MTRDIRLARRHALTPAEARTLAERVVGEFAERYGAATRWRGDVLSFSAPGAEGEVLLSESQIRVRVQLGLLLMPFRERLARHIGEQIESALAAHARRAQRGNPG